MDNWYNNVPLSCYLLGSPLQSTNYNLVCLLIGLPLAKAAGNAQTPWLEAIENRLAATAKVLGAMKAIKSTGLTDIVSSRVENLRLAEIHASLRHRVLIIFSAVICKYFAVFSKKMNITTQPKDITNHE